MLNKSKLGGLIAGLSLTLALAGCGEPKQAPPPVAPAPAAPVLPPPVPVEEPEQPDVQKFSGDTWELTVPSSVSRGRARNPNVVFAGLDNSEKRLILLVRKEVKGDSAADLNELYTEVKTDFMESGFIPTNEDKGTASGVPFKSIQGFKPPVTMYNWVLVKNEHGYLLACGGLMTQAARHAEVCSGVLRSLKLK